MQRTAQTNTCKIYKVNLNEHFQQYYIPKIISCYQGHKTNIYYTKDIQEFLSQRLGLILVLSQLQTAPVLAVP